MLYVYFAFPILRTLRLLWVFYGETETFFSAFLKFDVVTRIHPKQLESFFGILYGTFELAS